MTRIIGIGHSAGGAIMLALSARKTVPLSAVISVSGGLYHSEDENGVVAFNAFKGCEKFRDALVDTIGKYAENSNIPTLWLYAENDPWFIPSLARKMHNAWLSNNSNSELKIFPPTVINGHRIFFEKEGRSLILPEIDVFLRGIKWPTWNIESFNANFNFLDSRRREQLYVYLANEGSEKAMAMTKDGLSQLYYSSGLPTLDKARRYALSKCEQSEGKECKIIAENFEATWRN